MAYQELTEIAHQLVEGDYENEGRVLKELWEKMHDCRRSHRVPTPDRGSYFYVDGRERFRRFDPQIIRSLIAKLHGLGEAVTTGPEPLRYRGPNEAYENWALNFDQIIDERKYIRNQESAGIRMYWTGIPRKAK